MSLGRLLRRASSKASDLLTLTPAGSGSGSPCVLDGEIIYSKNNVCVHPPEGLQGLGEHHPGYLCLYMEKDEMLGATLILAWVPNSRIQRQDEEALRYITPESSPVRKAPRPRGRRTRSSGASHQPSPTELRPTLTPKDEDILVVTQSIPDGVLASPAPEDEEKLAQGLGVDGAQPASQPARSPSGILSTVSPQDVTEEGRELRPEAGEEDGSLELSAEGVSRDSSFDSDSDAFSSPFCLSPISAALAESRGSVFLESDSSDEACTSGQLVVASRESQYKVFHFHHGGLDKLSDVFQQWKYCTEMQLKDQQVAPDKTCMQFSIRRPKLPSSETHPEESMYKRLGVSAWLNHLNELGQVEEEYKLRKAIFFGGIDVSIRGEVWPFLLRYYSHESTSEEREALRLQKRKEYSEIQQKRLSMTPEEHRAFWRNVQFTVDKDVVRTDRNNQFFRGEDNPNVESMRRILLNYAVYNPAVGYSQGMSDLVAPILAEVLDESDTFWCFVGLMQNTIFVSSPRDEDMEKQLLYLRELLRLTHVRFYQHLVSLGEDGLQMLFCHRWLLLCFKREFPEAEALRIWEACWAHYQTDYFHLFICVAIVAIYGDDVIEQQLATDQMLLHFGNLAMHMNGELVLRKARSLLYQFRLLPRIPCSLHDLCKLCGTGMWDSGYMPAVECTGHHPGSESCPYGGTVEMPSPKPLREGKKGPKTPQDGFGFRR
ncbi:PREDICTED: TBC1 domain family member 16 isoform X4 [Cercocebus atys]|uniref:TBC1 domain family member 16 isoform X4 n=1 Tax=Cercocebus atys TaxID=9531 RepID=UPI0005F57A41|nr:PREDICTED: TBC1 domain family member 16 isoform X4 [Cercocebus atys]